MRVRIPSQRSTGRLFSQFHAEWAERFDGSELIPHRSGFDPRTPYMEYELTQGRIVVNDVRHVIDAETFHVFEIDLKSKYPGPVDWEYAYNDQADDEGFNIIVSIDVNPERTVKTDVTSSGLTSIFFPLAEKGWHAMSEASRYTWRIVLWKRPTSN